MNAFSTVRRWLGVTVRRWREDREMLENLAHLDERSLQDLAVTQTMYMRVNRNFGGRDRQQVIPEWIRRADRPK